MKRKAHDPVKLLRSKHLLRVLGAPQVSSYNAFLGPIAERILIALVKNTAFFGSASTNPFHFHHYMTNLVLHVNGVQNRAEPLTMN